MNKKRYHGEDLSHSEIFSNSKESVPTNGTRDTLTLISF